MCFRGDLNSRAMYPYTGSQALLRTDPHPPPYNTRLRCTLMNRIPGSPTSSRPFMARLYTYNVYFYIWVQRAPSRPYPILQRLVAVRTSALVRSPRDRLCRLCDCVISPIFRLRWSCKAPDRRRRGFGLVHASVHTQWHRGKSCKATSLTPPSSVDSLFLS